MKTKTNSEKENISKEESLKQVGKIVAGAYEDSQRVRIATTGRIRDIIRKKLEGIKVDQVEKKKEEKTFEKKYTDKELPSLLEQAENKGKITNRERKYIESSLEIAKESAKIEAKYKKAMLEYIQLEPVYTMFLTKIRGIGEVLSANLIKEFGYCEIIIYDAKEEKVIGRESGNKEEFEKAQKLYEDQEVEDDEKPRYSKKGYSTVGKLWAHSGYSTTAGIAPRKEKGKDLGFSPRLRTLIWKLSDCLMKLNHGIYRQLYTSEKAIQLARTFKEGELVEIGFRGYKKEDTKLKLIHAHNRALRKVGKMFLSHYWACTRELMELPLRELYVVEKLGHKKEDIITWQKAIKKEQ